ncbi:MULTISPECIES: hypothetical protein [Haloferax]|nr:MULTISPECIES: hypothetical protein [Haloferax]
MRGCEEAGSTIPITDLPDEVTSLDDLECTCWDEFDSFDELQ